MNNVLAKLEELAKGLELGAYSGKPGSLVQGGALQSEELDTVMHNVTFQDEHLKLQKELKVKKARGQLFQFNRRLSYGTMNSLAVAEGQVGREETGDYARVTVPMAYYAHFRRVTVQSMKADSFDGVSSDDRESEAGAKLIASSVEMDCFRGKADFSNAGVFDGDPNAIPRNLPNMVGLDPQIRESDFQTNAQDLMFDAFGSGLSNIILGAGTLTQPNVEDAWIRGYINFGTGNRLFLDPITLSAYSKLAYANKERFNLGATAQEPVTGVDVRRQAVSGGVVTLEPHHWLRAQTKPKKTVAGAPGAPSIALAQAASTTAFTVGQVYTYYVSAENEVGESLGSTASAITIATLGNQVNVTITPGTGTARQFNVFRSAPGGSAASAKLIGRVRNSGAATTVFNDLGNRLPGGVTGFLVQPDTMELREMSPYSRMPLATVDLSKTEAHFRFVCLAVYEPRKNVIIDNLTGSL